MNGLDPREFADELALIAQNDGDAYRDGKNAEHAVRCAFDAFVKRRRREELDEFHLVYVKLAADLRTRWGKDDWPGMDHDSIVAWKDRNGSIGPLETDQGFISHAIAHGVANV